MPQHLAGVLLCHRMAADALDKGKAAPPQVHRAFRRICFWGFQHLHLGFVTLKGGTEEQQLRSHSWAELSLLGSQLLDQHWQGCSKIPQTRGQRGRNASNPTSILAGFAAPAKEWREFCGVCG